MSRLRSLMSNTLVFTAGKLISKLLVFFMMRLYTSCMTDAEYSEADLIVQTANLLIPLACVGISEGIFRSAAAKSGNKEAFFTNGLAVLGVGTLAFLLFSPLLTLIPRFEESAWLIAIFVIMSNIHAVVSQYLCAIGRTKLFAGQGILNTVFVIGLNILFLPVLDMGVNGYVLSTVIADGLTTLFLIFFARLWRAFKPKTVSWKVIAPMLKFCIPLIPTTIFWWVTGTSDRYLVAEICSEAENGLYAAAYKVPTLLIYVVSVFDSAWKLSVSEEDEATEENRQFFSRVWRMYTTIAFLGGAGLILFCRLFAHILYAESFRAAWVYIPVLTLATVFTALDTFLGSVYYKSKRTVGSMLTALCGAGVNIVLNLWMIPYWGGMGASLATFISYFLVFLIRLGTTHKLVAFDREIIRNLINTLLLGGLTVTMTLTDGSFGKPIVWWGASVVMFLAIGVFNLKALKELLRSGVRLLRGKC